MINSVCICGAWDIIHCLPITFAGACRHTKYIFALSVLLRSNNVWCVVRWCNTCAGCAVWSVVKGIFASKHNALSYQRGEKSSYQSYKKKFPYDAHWVSVKVIKICIILDNSTIYFPCQYDGDIMRGVAIVLGVLLNDKSALMWRAINSLAPVVCESVFFRTQFTNWYLEHFLWNWS